MSIKVITYVWEHSKQERTRLLLMIALADQCNDDGFCWGGHPHFAKKCRITERYVQSLIADLEMAGEVTVYQGMGIPTKSGPTNCYKINMPGINDDLKPNSPIAATTTKPIAARKRTKKHQSTQSGRSKGTNHSSPDGTNHSSPLESEGTNHSSPDGTNHDSPKPFGEPSFQNEPSIYPKEKDPDPTGQGSPVLDLEVDAEERAVTFRENENDSPEREKVTDSSLGNEGGDTTPERDDAVHPAPKPREWIDWRTLDTSNEKAQFIAKRWPGLQSFQSDSVKYPRAHGIVKVLECKKKKVEYPFSEPMNICELWAFTYWMRCYQEDVFEKLSADDTVSKWVHEFRANHEHAGLVELGTLIMSTPEKEPEEVPVAVDGGGAQLVRQLIQESGILDKWAREPRSAITGEVMP